MTEPTTGPAAEVDGTPLKIPASEFEFDVTLLRDEYPDLAVRWGGFQRLSPESVANEHTHYRYGFVILVLTGYGRFTCGEKAWKLEPGVVFWACPNLSTRFEISQGSPPIEHYVVMPFGTHVADWFDRYLGADLGAAPVIDIESTARMFEVIMDEGRGGGNHLEENCVDLVKTLIRRLESQLVSGRTSGNNSRQTYVRARQHIQKNFSQIRDLGDVAGFIGVTVPYLCRLFDRYGKSTAFDFLTRLKLTKAERLLCTRDLSIREIGEAVGFPDLQLFSRNFKNQYGVSPSYYRNARRKENGRAKPSL